jgi:four helix bundle protein
MEIIRTCPRRKIRGGAGFRIYVLGSAEKENCRDRSAVMGYTSFEDLEVWKRSCRLAVRLYEILRECRDFGLKDQMTRAAVSIASNIAEGAERNSSKDYIRFLHIAKGSAAELRTQLYIAHKVGYIAEEDMQELISEAKTISKQLHCLVQALT